MTIKPFKVFGALMLLGLASIASASTVTLVPLGNVSDLVEGDIVTFAVDIDFTDDGSTIGGGFDVMFDAASLQYNGDATLDIGDPGFSRTPDDCANTACVGGGAGLLESWAVADFATIVSGRVGTLSFTVLAGAAASSLVSLGPTQGIGGPWVSGVDFITQLDPMYNAVEVTTAVIPVPAAVWFMLSGLGALFGMRRSAA